MREVNHRISSSFTRFQGGSSVQVTLIDIQFWLHTHPINHCSMTALTFSGAEEVYDDKRSIKHYHCLSTIFH